MWLEKNWIVASLGSTCCVLWTCQRSHPKKTKIVWILTIAAQGSRVGVTAATTTTEATLGLVSATPASLHRLKHTYELWRLLCKSFVFIVSFSKKIKNLLSSIITAWLNLYIFFRQIWGSFCIIKQQKCSDYAYFLAFFGLELRLNQPYESCRTPTAFVVVKLASKLLPIAITVNVALKRWRKAKFLAQFTMISHGATWSNWEKDGACWISLWSSLQDENVKPLWLPLLLFYYANYDDNWLNTLGWAQQRFFSRLLFQAT